VVTQAFAVYPDGSVNLLTSCTVTAPPVTQPAPPAGNLLGYIKISTGPNFACDDASSTGRTAVYGSGIANGNVLYTDAALTQKYNGGWNWFSFTPTLGGATTYAFAVYPTGGILLLRSCTGGARIAAGAVTTTTTAEQDMATLQRMKDSAITAESLVKNAAIAGRKINIYPNPVSSAANIEFNSTDGGMRTVYIYNSNGVLAARYNWQTVAGKNVFSLKNISGLTNGLYIVEIKDSKGKTDGSSKFLKIQ